MAKHYCIDPHDPFAQAEVLVEFEGAYPTITLISAINADQEDVLPDLVEEQKHDLQREIAAFFQPGSEGPSPTAEQPTSSRLHEHVLGLA